MRAGVGRWRAGPGPGNEGRARAARGTAGPGVRRPDPAGAAPGTGPYSPCPSSDRCPGPAPSAKTFSPGPGGLGGRVGGDRGAGVPSSPPPPPAWGRELKSWVPRTPGFTRRERGQGGGGKGTPRVLVAPRSGGPGRHGGGRRRAGELAGGGRGGGAEPARAAAEGGGGGAGKEGTSGGGAGRAGPPRPRPLPPALKGAARGGPGAPGAEAGCSALRVSMFSQERGGDSPEGKARETPRQSARDAERQKKRGRNVGRERETYKETEMWRETRDTERDKD